MRVFIDDEGKFYKGKEAKSISHQERPGCNQEFIDALSESTPWSLIDVEVKMQRARVTSLSAPRGETNDSAKGD